MISAGTLNKRDESTRQMLADDFIGAFKDNAGTEVTTDIIFLKKHDDKTLDEMSDIDNMLKIVRC